MQCKCWILLKRELPLDETAGDEQTSVEASGLNKNWCNTDDDS